ncbi:MAG: hypothetical protein EVB11_01550 [Winogradskyella sp.]|nr:MAG: hypothetical protein EVB11_01550 [Winogradskyella sp.]
MKSGLGYLVQKLLSYNTIAIDKNELEFQIESHPSYPSLHAITGVLDHFNVDNLALDIPKNEETLAQLPKAFLTQIETIKGKEFVVAVNKGLNYQLINSSKKDRLVTIKEFLKQFTGIIVGVEKTEFTDESKKTNQVYSQSLIGLSIIIVIGLVYMLKPTLQSVLFLTTSFLGLVISLAIKKQEQGEVTMLGDTFCSGESEKKDCNAVLESKGARVFNDYKLSDLSIVYFLGLISTTLMLSVANQSITITHIISFLAIPITFYSIYYQGVIIKKWCLLCLSIVGILWAQAGLFLIDTDVLNSLEILWTPAALVLSCFILTFTVYHQLSLKLNELNSLKKLKVDFYKFKRNFKLFETLLQKSKAYNTIDNQDFQGILIGNREAKLKITIITNPFCGHCKPVHALVEDIYKKYAKEVTIQIYFNINPKDKESKSTKVVTRLLELYKTKGLGFCMDAMHSVYENQDTKLWLEEFGSCNDTEYFSEILEQQYNWCIENSINFTPEILVNGKSYPKEYDRGDLLLFIEDLYENCCANITELQLTI